MSVEVRDSYDAIAELYASLNLDALDQYTQRLWVPNTRSWTRDQAFRVRQQRRRRSTGSMYLGFVSPLRHVSRKPWSERCGRFGRGSSVSDLSSVQACDQGFCRHVGGGG